MTQKVLLISVNRCLFPYPVFPLGVSHLASALKAAGYAPAICDLQVNSSDFMEVITSVSPDYIGLSLRNIDNTDSAETDFFAPILSEVAQKVREVSSAPIMLGGSGYSLFPKELLKLTGADFGICGEGEVTFPLLLDCLSTQRPHDSIPGLVYTKNGSIVINPKSGCVADAISMVERPQNLVDYYLEQSTMLNIQTQRGCSYTCCYCTYPVIEGTMFRRRSPQAVCDEIEDATGAGARYLFIVDSVFNTSKEHVTGICEEILRRSITTQWGCFLRPQGITQALMNLMARAGLTHIEFGTDSLCDSVLEAYGKDFSVADVIQASECAHNAGVKYAHFLIIGGPTETEDTIREGFANSSSIKKTVFFPSVGMRLYPDTPLYTFAVKEGAVSEETDLLPPRFYITPNVSVERIRQLLKEHNTQAKNWIIGTLDPALQKVVVNLRKIGVVGPLWEFIVR